MTFFACLAVTAVAHGQTISERLESVAALSAHIQQLAADENNPLLSGAEIEAHQAVVEGLLDSSSSDSAEDNPAVLAAIFGLVETYDNSNFGPLWVQGSRIQKFTRNSTSNEDIHWVIYGVMQNIMDHVYTVDNILQNGTTLDGFKFGSSSHFPGAVAPPQNPNDVYTVSISGSYLNTFGRDNMDSGYSRKPTGAYVAPGSIVTVTVPSSLVDAGYKIRVGAHSWDFKNKGNVLRLDRISLVSDIDNEVMQVANPMGGNIYIEVPYLADAGVVQIQIQNAVRAPYYSAKSFHQTTLEEWEVERNHPGPFADFQSDKFMMQIPSSWLVNLDRPDELMATWDGQMDVVNDIMGYDRILGKETLYTQVDLQFRSSYFAPGYPFSNSNYDPDKAFEGNYEDNYHITGYSHSYTLYHELGHQYLIPRLESSESETNVNYLPAAVQYLYWGKSWSESLRLSVAGTYRILHEADGLDLIDNAALAWIMTDSFQADLPMQWGDMNYQHKGHARYLDLARLFGWDKINGAYRAFNEKFENGVTVNILNAPEDFVLHFSESFNVDLRPLFHFWGVFPDDLEVAAWATNSYPPSAEIYEQLIAYKEAIPDDKPACEAFMIDWWGGTLPLETNDVNRGDRSSEKDHALRLATYNTSAADVLRAKVQAIIDLYFPNGSPEKVLFADTFDRPDTTSLKDGDGLGQSGSLGKLNYNTQTFDNTVLDINSGSLRIDGPSGSGTAGGLVYINNQNFVGNVFENVGRLSVSVDIVNYSTAGSSRQMSIGVGQSLAELMGQEGVAPSQHAADLLVSYRNKTDTLEIYKNGVLDSSEIVVGGLPNPNTTMRIEYEFTSFNAGDTVNYEVYFGNSTAAFTSGSFVWSGTNENFISLSSNLTRTARFDNLMIKATGWDTFFDGSSDTVLFSDTFNRANTDRVNADSTLNKLGSLGELNYTARTFNNSTLEIKNSLLCINSATTNGADGGLLYINNHNFVGDVYSGVARFSISVDIANYSTAGSSRQMSIGVGQSSAELAEQEGVAPSQHAADLLVSYRNKTDTLEIYKNGVLDSSETVVGGLPNPNTTMRIEYEFTSFNAGDTVNYEVYFGNSTAAFTSGSFVWSGTNENFISLSSNLTRIAGFDNLVIKAAGWTPDASVESDAVIFADTFNRSDSDLVNDDNGLGKSGKLGELTYATRKFNSVLDISDGKLRVNSNTQNGDDGGLLYINNHNFIGEFYGGVARLSVSVDIAQYSTAGNNRQMSIGVGQSLAELNSQSGVGANQHAADLLVSYRRTNNSLEIYKNGVLDSSETVVDGLPGPNTTMRIEYEFSSFNAGDVVSYEVYFDNSADAFTSGSFVWSGTNENYISLSSNLTNDARFDNLVIEAVGWGALADSLLVNDVPASWLQNYGIPATDAGALADTDGDGRLNWQEYAVGGDPLINDNQAGIRVTEYYLTADDFSGTTTSLTLDQDLASDYFVLVRGSREGSGESMPDNDYARVTAVPNRAGGTGGLADSGSANTITLTRAVADVNWEGVVTVVECQAPTSTGGFKLVDILSTSLSGTAGTATSAPWSDINQVVLFGGYRGGGASFVGNPTTRNEGTSVYTRLYPSGSDTLNWTRQSGGETLLDAVMTTFVIEWGAEWKIQRVNVAGTAGGNGADTTGEYLTQSIDPVNRANTWVWGTGTRNDAGLGDCAEASLVTLGDGVSQNITETKVALGSEYSDQSDFDVYAMTHPNLVVDYRFKPDGDTSKTDLGVTVNSAEAGTRLALSYNGCNGVGNYFPRPRMWARYTANGEVTISRGRSGQSFPAWIQGIDFSELNE